jgi:phosphoglycerate dehydrogenase-like enzyme
MTRIVVLDDYQGVAHRFGGWERLPAGCEVVYSHEHLDSLDAVCDALSGAEVAIAMRERTPLGGAHFERLSELKLLVTTGMANAAIDVAAAASAGIVVCGTGGNPRATVEHAWALILALARSIPNEDAGMRAGAWQRTIGTDLSGSILGLVGFGRLGSAMAPVALAFGMEVLAWSQNLDPAAAAEAGAEAVDKTELFERADFVSVHYRLSPRSKSLVGVEELARMKPSAFLINTSRGPLVDRDALLAGLNAGEIAGAALDVYDVEPLPADDPFRRAQHTVLSPHLGYVTADTYSTFYSEAVEDILAYLDGNPIRVLSA